MSAPTHFGFQCIIRLSLFFFVISSPINVNAQYTTTGTATVTDPNCVQLTTAGGSQAGCAYYATPIDFSQDFIQQFTMNFGSNPSGADGMTIIYEGSGGVPCGGSGGNIAYNGIGPSWIVEFDTWNTNSENGDPGSPVTDYVEFHINGDPTNALMSAPVGELEDGQDRDVKILWTADSQTFQVFVNGVSILSMNYDIVNDIFGGQNLVYFGHSASTGGAVNVHTACLYNFEQNPTIDIIIEGPFTICDGDTYDVDGTPQSTPGEYLKEVDICVSETYVQLGVMDFSVDSPDQINCNTTDACVTLSANAFVTNYDFSIDNNITYAWTTIDGDIQSDEDTPNPTVCSAGTYEVTFSANGISCTETVLVEEDGVQPDEPVFSGDDLICLQNGDPYIASYEAPTLDGIADYQWTIPDGAAALNGDVTSPTIDIEFGVAEEGEVCLFVTNECDLTNSFCLPVSIQETPELPIIIGNVEVCEGIETYIASNIPEGISSVVAWSVPTDAVILGNPFDTAIDVDWTGSNGGEVCAFYDNDCGTIQECIEVTITTTATTPVIDGLFLICPAGDVFQDYNITTAPENTILWTVTDGVILGDNDMDVVTIDWAGSTMGEVCVEVITDCGTENACETLFYITPQTCDDNICANGIETWDATICQCVSGTPPTVCVDDQDCTNGFESWDAVNCECIVEPPIFGCIDPQACNYNVSATCDDDSCILEMNCDDNICANGIETWDATICQCVPGTPPTVCVDDQDCTNGFEVWDELLCDCEIIPPVFGCTDPNDPNYDALATCDDGSCGCEEISPPTGVQPVTYCADDFVPPLLVDDPGMGFEIVWMDALGMEVGTGIVFNPPSNGVYSVVVREITTGCTSEAIATSVTEIALPLTLILQDSATLDCISATYEIDGSGSSTGSEYEYQWAGPDEEAFINNSTIIISLSGTYTLTVMDIVNGCSTSDSIVIIENIDYPELLVAETEILDCDTDEVILSGVGSQQSASISNYWIAPNGVDTISFDVNATAVETGTYTFYGFDSDNNCINDVTVEVLGDFVAPLADAGPDIFLDCDESLQTIGSENSSSGNSIIYDWATDNSDVVLPVSPPLFVDVNVPGTYTLTVSDDNNGCFSTDIVNVFESENNIELTDLTVIDPECYGETGAIFMNEPIGGTPPYLYALDESPYSSSSAFIDLPAGNYDVAILDAEGCEFETNVIIESPNELLVDLGEDIFIELGDSVSLTALTNQLADSISWVSVDTLSCESCLITTLTPNLTTTVALFVYDENGCIATDEINIIVNKERNVFVPNSFSPNADGINDILSIFAGQDVEIINTFMIFDRWGEQVYSANEFLPNNPNVGWDGNLNGNPMNPAVFVYYVQITFVDGATEVFSGDVALFR